jgi:uncharacterized protein
MGWPAVIVGTNVVVAGLLTKQDTSPVAHILDGMLGAAFPFVLSEALLAEYRGVLVRPVLRQLPGLTVAEREAILTDLAQHAIVWTSEPTPPAPPAPDPGHRLLWDLLTAKADLVLVAGDKRPLRDAGMRERVISPSAFASAAHQGIRTVPTALVPSLKPTRPRRGTIAGFSLATLGKCRFGPPFHQ